MFNPTLSFTLPTAARHKRIDQRAAEFMAAGMEPRAALREARSETMADMAFGRLIRRAAEANRGQALGLPRGGAA